MREEDRMVNLDKIEKVAKMCGFEYRRENVRSLTVIKVFDEGSKSWMSFDPVFNGKDIARMLYYLAKTQDAYDKSEMDFREDLLNWIIDSEGRRWTK